MKFINLPTLATPLLLIGPCLAAGGGNDRNKRLVSEPLTLDDDLTPLPSVSTGTPAAPTTTPGFTIPTSETSTPTETGTVTIGTILPSESTTNTAGAVGPTGTETRNLSGAISATDSATGTSASATGAAGTIGDGRGGSTVALVVAIGVGLVGWVGL